MTFDQIRKQISDRKFVPVYYLHGEESWFIDKLVEMLDADGVVLNQSEAAFNRSLLYGAETNASQIVQACRSFPVMANHRLVIVRDAHRMNKKEWEKVVPYLQQAVPSTVLVLAFKDRNAGLPKAGVEAVKKQGVNFHAKKMYDRDVQQWISGYVQDSGFTAEAGIPAILTANLGLELGLIQNELEKMFIYLRATQQNKLSKNFVYEMINVDKSFNVFELIHALAERNHYQAHLIIDRLTQNTRINPPVLTINGLFRFFRGVALVHRFKLRDPNSIKHQLNVNYYQAKDYEQAARRYSVAHIHRNFHFLREADLRLKGMIPTHTDDRHILRTLVWQLLS